MDIDLGVTNFQAQKEGSPSEELVLTCQGTHQGQLVGFDLLIQRWFPWGLRDTTNYPREYFADKDTSAIFNSQGWQRNGVKVRARGPETDRLLDFMREHFKVTPKPLVTQYAQNVVGLSAIAFVPEDHDVKKSFSAIKLVYDDFDEEDGNETAYWEAFLRIDPLIGAVRLEEKDISFREAQVNVLSNAFGLAKF